MGKEHSERRKPKQKEILPPPITEIGKWKIVRVEHSKTPFPIQHQDMIADADHILFESRFFALGRQNDYETIARDIFNLQKKQNNIHYLEDNFDVVTAGEHYGMDLQTAIFPLATLVAKGILVTSRGNTERRQRAFENGISTLTEYSPKFAQLADTEQRRILESSLANLKPGNVFQLLRTERALQAIVAYQASIRDFETIGPRVTQLKSEIPPEESVIVVLGKNHLPTVVQALQGDQIDPPKQWNEYIKDLPKKAQRAIKRTLPSLSH